MKIRNGFVSNSSTSIFILVGFKATAKQIAEYRAKEEASKKGYFNDGEDENGVSCIDEEGENLLGFYTSVDDYGVGDIGIEDISEQAARLRKIYGDRVKVRLYAGTRQS